MSVCARCGAEFSCAMVDADAAGQPCWCTHQPAGFPVPATPGATCWCPACLKQRIADHAADIATSDHAAAPHAPL